MCSIKQNLHARQKWINFSFQWTKQKRIKFRIPMDNSSTGKRYHKNIQPSFAIFFLFFGCQFSFYFSVQKKTKDNVLSRQSDSGACVTSSFCSEMKWEIFKLTQHFKKDFMKYNTKLNFVHNFNCFYVSMQLRREKRFNL